MPEIKKFAVTYTIDYQHRVVVGVSAFNTESAIEIASKAFEEGVIWENNPNMPLLFDDYEEVEAETLKFSAVEIHDFPEPDSSVKQLKYDFALCCIQSLLAGETTTALEFAQKALPQLVASRPEEMIWQVQSDNGCDPFEVSAMNREDALRDALFAIGWSVSPKT